MTVLAEIPRPAEQSFTMRVVVGLAQPPHPEGNAPGKTSVGLILGLRRNGVDAVAVAARQHFSSHIVPPADLDVQLVDVPPRESSWRARADMLCRPRSYLSRTAFGERVRELAAAADILHLEETETAAVRAGCAVPSVVHVHLLTLRDRSLGRPIHKAFYSTLECVLAERAAARRQLALVASSPLIADHLRAIAPRADVVVAPLSLDPSGYVPASLDRPVVGLIGTGSWEPTAVAMRRLVERVWPLVTVRAPGSTLVIAGRGSDRLALQGQGVEVVGEVDSGAEFMQGISVLLYPIARGSGMKVKVLEALACGVPVVTTPEGAEGIAPNDGVIVEVDDGALADAAAELLRDTAARKERGAAALRAFQTHYAPEIATRPLVDLYRRMLERG